jgi:hypothetical protein
MMIRKFAVEVSSCTSSIAAALGKFSAQGEGAPPLAPVPGLIFLYFPEEIASPATQGIRKHIF